MWENTFALEYLVISWVISKNPNAPTIKKTSEYGYAIKGSFVASYSDSRKSDLVLKLKFKYRAH